LWTLYQQAKAWKKLPSELLHLGPEDDPFDAYSIDQAVWSFGNTLEQELQAAEDSKKSDRAKRGARAQVMKRWFPHSKDVGPRLRDPGTENPEGLRR
jgi:hypothetical protein